MKLSFPIKNGDVLGTRKHGNDIGFEGCIYLFLPESDEEISRKAPCVPANRMLSHNCSLQPSAIRGASGFEVSIAEANDLVVLEDYEIVLRF